MTDEMCGLGLGHRETEALRPLNLGSRPRPNTAGVQGRDDLEHPRRLQTTVEPLDGRLVVQLLVLIDGGKFVRERGERYLCAVEEPHAAAPITTVKMPAAAH